MMRPVLYELVRFSSIQPIFNVRDSGREPVSLIGAVTPATRVRALHSHQDPAGAYEGVANDVEYFRTEDCQA